MKILAAAIAIANAACAYDAAFSDCTIRCSDAIGCPIGLSCGAEGLCRSSGETAACAAEVPRPPSCDGLAATCGASVSEDCCSSATTIPGGTFFRSYDVAVDGMYPDMSYPATVSAFVLDKYDVTVGRFRRFVDAGQGTQANPPVPGAGAHPNIAMSGWDLSWNADLAVDMPTLLTDVDCSAANHTWTNTAAGNETRAMNCIDWYVAMAFCTWDGGFLPTEAEWNYAASGGSEQRAYPWSSPPGALTIDCSYANYGCVDATDNVGAESPKGDGKWGQSDLAGNVYNWTLDWYGPPYIQNPCTDCANLTPDANAARILRGASRFEPATSQRASYRIAQDPSAGDIGTGFRCARPPSI